MNNWHGRQCCTIRRWSTLRWLIIILIESAVIGSKLVEPCAVTPSITHVIKKNNRVFLIILYMVKKLLFIFASGQYGPAARWILRRGGEATWWDLDSRTGAEDAFGREPAPARMCPPIYMSWVPPSRLIFILCVTGRIKDLKTKLLFIMFFCKLRRNIFQAWDFCDRLVLALLRFRSDKMLFRSI